MRLLCAFICCLLFTRASGQEPDTTIIEVSELRYFDSVEKKCFLVNTPKGVVNDKDIPFLNYPSESNRKGMVNDSLMEKDCFIKFTVRNSSDTIRQLYFVPGYYLKSLKLYKASPSNIKASFRELPSDTDNLKIFKDCGLITVAPHETAVYYARFNFVRTYANSYIPRIIEKEFLWSWVMMMKTRDGFLNIITYVASGIMLLMIFYSLAVYLQNKRTEFLFYSAYALCSLVMMFLKSYLHFRPSEFMVFYEEWLDFMILSAGVFFYLGFIRKFLNTGIKEPFLEIMLRVAGVALFILLAVFSYIYFFTDKYVVLNVLENYVIKLLIFVISIIVITYSFKKERYAAELFSCRKYCCCVFFDDLSGHDHF